MVLGVSSLLFLAGGAEPEAAAVSASRLTLAGLVVVEEEEGVWVDIVGAVAAWKQGTHCLRHHIHPTSHTRVICQYNTARNRRFSFLLAHTHTHSECTAEREVMDQVTPQASGIDAQTTFQHLV